MWEQNLCCQVCWRWFLLQEVPRPKCTATFGQWPAEQPKGSELPHSCTPKVGGFSAHKRPGATKRSSLLLPREAQKKTLDCLCSVVSLSHAAPFEHKTCVQPLNHVTLNRVCIGSVSTRVHPALTENTLQHWLPEHRSSRSCRERLGKPWSWSLKEPA